MNVTFPSTPPTMDAANFTENVTLCPVPRLKGIVKPLILKPEPVSTAWLTLIGVFPVFAKVTGRELVEPTLVLTVSLSGATESEGRDSATPTQPTPIKVEHSNISTRTILL